MTTRRGFIQTLTAGLLGAPLIAKAVTAVPEIEKWYAPAGFNRGDVHPHGDLFLMLDRNGLYAKVWRRELPIRVMFHCEGIKNVTKNVVVKWRTHEARHWLETASAEGVPEAWSVTKGEHYPIIIGYRASNGFSVG